MSESYERIAPMPSDSFQGTEEQVSDTIIQILKNLQKEQIQGGRTFSLEHLHSGDRIHAERLALGLTRLELAQEAGVNPVWLAFIEEGVLPARLLPEDEEAISKVEKFLSSRRGR